MRCDCETLAAVLLGRSLHCTIKVSSKQKFQLLSRAGIFVYIRTILLLLGAGAKNVSERCEEEAHDIIAETSGNKDPNEDE